MYQHFLSEDDLFKHTLEWIEENWNPDFLQIPDGLFKAVSESENGHVFFNKNTICNRCGQVAMIAEKDGINICDCGNRWGQIYFEDEEEFDSLKSKIAEIVIFIQDHKDEATPERIIELLEELI